MFGTSAGRCARSISVAPASNNSEGTITAARQPRRRASPVKECTGRALGFSFMNGVLSIPSGAPAAAFSLVRDSLRASSLVRSRRKAQACGGLGEAVFGRVQNALLKTILENMPVIVERLDRPKTFLMITSLQLTYVGSHHVSNCY